MIHLLVLPFLLIQDPRDSLSLDAALALARSQRGQLRAAAAGVAVARAGVRVASAVTNPVGVYSHTQDPPHQHASLEQSFDWLLTRGADRAAARSGLVRAQADSAQSAADLEGEVRQAFYGCMAAQALERVTREQQVLADSLVGLAAERLTRGDISELERDQLVLEATRAAQRRSRAREATGVAWARLARTIGWSADTAQPALAGALDDGLAAAPDPVLPSTARLASLPRLVATLADSAAAEGRARRARRARVPLPSVQVGADWDDPASGKRLLALFGVVLPLPLWHHGAGVVAQAEAEAAQAAAGASESRLETTRALSDAATRLREARGRAAVAQDSLLRVARRIRTRATAAYRAGETGLIPLLEALRSERDVTAETVDDLLAYQEARAAWKQVLGESE
jgi:cobalt-zinc-cadmium efflux system outer membrane protein